MNSKLMLSVIVSVFVITSLNVAFADPLDDVSATVLEFDGTNASVELTWNHDDAITNYEVGCVSCLPNFSVNTTDDEIVLSDITPLENGIAVLYVIAYYDNSEMITAKQVMLELS